MTVEIKRLAIEEFKAQAKASIAASAKLAAGLVVPKDIAVESIQVAGEDDVREFVASTADVDRDQDTVSPSGWDLTNYAKSGTFLWAHDSKLPPIAKPLSTWTDDKALRTRVRFAPADMPHPLGLGFGNTVMRMFDGGFLKGVSVGFMPLEWAFNEARGGMAMDFHLQELLEISAVPVPSNPNALMQARSKGINVDPLIAWAETTRDDATGLWLPKDAAAQILAQAKSTKTISIPAAAPVPETAPAKPADEAVTPAPPAPAASVAETKTYEAAIADATAAESKLVDGIKSAAALIAKQGRVLSKKNEDDLRSASDLILAVLHRVVTPDDSKAAKGVTPEEIREIVGRAIDAQINKLTGRLPA